MSGMPVPSSFIDTNILLYAVSTHPAETEKTRIARELLDREDWGWSAQVAAEFVRASTSPRQVRPFTRPQAREWLLTWSAFPSAAVDHSLVVDALDLGHRFQISHFDAQILVAARRLGCARVYSEDLNHGQDYEGVRVVNPFRA
jgi:predicted nucleic acid-binding protein